MSLLVPGTVLMVLATGLTALAQSQPSLAEIAEREIARRKALASPARVYTNDDLKLQRPLTMAAARPVAPPAGDAGAAGIATPAGAASAPTPAAPAAATPNPAAALAGRLTEEREALARARAEFEALQARVTTLTGDWVVAPDEASRASIAAARDAAAADAERMRAAIDSRTKALAQLELDVLRQARPASPPR
jgi:FAD/FMN-containing dehydrogenase